MSQPTTIQPIAHHPPQTINKQPISNHAIHPPSNQLYSSYYQIYPYQNFTHHHHQPSSFKHHQLQQPSIQNHNLLLHSKIDKLTQHNNNNKSINYCFCQQTELHNRTSCRQKIITNLFDQSNSCMSSCMIRNSFYCKNSSKEVKSQNKLISQKLLINNPTPKQNQNQHYLPSNSWLQDWFHFLDIHKNGIINKSCFHSKSLTPILRCIFGSIVHKIKYKGISYLKQQFINEFSKPIMFLKPKQISAIKRQIYNIITSQQHKKNQRYPQQKVSQPKLTKLSSNKKNEEKQMQLQKEQNLKYLDSNRSWENLQGTSSPKVPNTPKITDYHSKCQQIQNLNYSPLSNDEPKKHKMLIEKIKDYKIQLMFSHNHQITNIRQ